MEIKGAIFDMDGVLFDTERIYQETWQEIARDRRIELPSSFPKAISGTNGEYMRRTLEQYYHVTDGTEIAAECMKRIKEKLQCFVPVKEGVRDMLQFLQKQKLKMAVASSSSRQQIQQNLHISGLAEYFPIIVSGEDVNHGKPAPDIFEYASKKLQCRPEECLVFEDSENGIRAGHSAHCITIMIPDLFTPSAEIMPHCSQICQNMIQALEEVKRML